MKKTLYQAFYVLLLLSPLSSCSSKNQTEQDHGATQQEAVHDTAAESIAAPAGRQDKKLARIKLPKGFRISYFAQKVNGARSMTISPGGTVFVGTRKDKVYALRDTNKDGQADEVLTIAKGLNSPNGVAFKDGDLYVAEINRILKFPNIEQNLNNPPKPVVVYDKYPKDKHHGWKFIAFGPDGKLYVPVGAPCNICESENPVFASITRLNPDGSGFEIFAEGVRNTVGFDWHPGTKELWFTDNGRDMMGDNLPPDELNRAPEKGMHFGYPYCHGGNVTDPEFGRARNCSEFEKPVRNLDPHTAALGMRFYTGNLFPAEYRNQVFIAEHGSWNRSKPIGYRVMLVKNPDSANPTYEPFADGWLTENEEVLGRPVDVQVMADGSLLVSDDEGNAVYRITYQP